MPTLARVTVLESIQKSAEFLQKKGVEPARLHAELLLAHVLKLPRMKLYLNFERALSSQETDALRELVRRRGQREPLQHITGSTSFCGFEVAVNQNVLVPRPETELLAEEGWKFLKNVPHPRPLSGPAGERGSNSTPITALDFGTGSGCIAIALAAKVPTANIFALDVSAEALALARHNAQRKQVAERIQFFHGDGFAALPEGTANSFDLIISNPPYIATAEIETLDPEVRDFDPRNALDGGADGLDFYRRLANESVNFLKPGGQIMVEFGDDQAEPIRAIFEAQKWIVETIREDYTQRQRILIARL
jgi:release factor glutamine methyltransferase